MDGSVKGEMIAKDYPGVSDSFAATDTGIDGFLEDLI